MPSCVGGSPVRWPLRCEEKTDGQLQASGLILPHTPGDQTLDLCLNPPLCTPPHVCNQHLEGGFQSPPALRTMPHVPRPRPLHTVRLLEQGGEEGGRGGGNLAAAGPAGAVLILPPRALPFLHGLGETGDRKASGAAGGSCSMQMCRRHDRNGASAYAKTANQLRPAAQPRNAQSCHGCW